jgi:hypothetical protein
MSQIVSRVSGKQGTKKEEPVVYERTTTKKVAAK